MPDTTITGTAADTSTINQSQADNADLTTQQKIDSGLITEKTNTGPVPNAGNLSIDEHARAKHALDHGKAFIDLLRGLGTSRELSLSITKAEEAVMWALQHLKL